MGMPMPAFLAMPALPVPKKIARYASLVTSNYLATSQLRGFFVTFAPHSGQNDHFLTHEKLFFMSFKGQKFKNCVKIWRQITQNV